MIRKLRQQLEDRIEDTLSAKEIHHAILRKASKYAMQSGGKRLRPLMALSICGEVGLDVAVAIESIHTYSLIHDDLPAMDDDDMRRDQPSLHIAFDEATAILTGDALLTLAFKLIAESELPSEKVALCTASLAQAAGMNKMIEGQMLDLYAKEKSIRWSAYQRLVMKKTSALFVSALECGAIIANYSESDIKQLRHFGEIFGLTYQIHDDLNDLGLPSAVSIVGREKAIEIANLLIKHSEETLSKLSFRAGFLESVVEGLATSLSNLAPV